MTLSILKKYLKGLSRKEVELIITDLYKLNTVNKEFLTNKIEPENEEEILEKYKKTIKNELFPDRGDPKLRYSIMRTAISDFKKISKDPANLLDLMLFYVEESVDFTNMYGDIDEDFYVRVEKMFEAALIYSTNYNLLNLYEERCQDIVEDSSDIGWGFCDEMDSLFCLFYEVDRD